MLFFIIRSSLSLNETKLNTNYVLNSHMEATVLCFVSQFTCMYLQNQTKQSFYEMFLNVLDFQNINNHIILMCVAQDIIKIVQIVQKRDRFQPSTSTNFKAILRSDSSFGFSMKVVPLGVQFTQKLESPHLELYKNIYGQNSLYYSSSPAAGQHQFHHFLHPTYPININHQIPISSTNKQLTLSLLHPYLVHTHIIHNSCI